MSVYCRVSANLGHLFQSLHYVRRDKLGKEKELMCGYFFSVSANIPALLLKSLCGRQECQKDKEPLLAFLQIINNGAFIVLVRK